MKYMSEIYKNPKTIHDSKAKETENEIKTKILMTDTLLIWNLLPSRL